MTNHTESPEQIVEAECPFCGVTDMSCLQGELLVGELTADNTEIVRIHCQGCGAMGPIVELQIEDGRLADPPWEAWNRRALPAMQGRDPEKLEGLLEAVRDYVNRQPAERPDRDDYDMSKDGWKYGSDLEAWLTAQSLKPALAAFEGGE